MRNKVKRRKEFIIFSLKQIKKTCIYLQIWNKMAKIFRFLASNVFKFWPKNRLQLHSLSHELAFVLSISRKRFNNLHFLLLAVSNFAHSKLLFPRRKRKKQTNLEKNGNGQTKERKYCNVKWRWKCLQKFINFAFAQLLNC